MKPLINTLFVFFIGHSRSTSKASYLAYRRERGAPDSEGSYKRTMSPTARLDDWPPLRERDDPVLLRVTPYNQNINERTKSHSVDALHSRIEERTNAHTVEVIGKLSQELTKKLQSTEQRTKCESNNNCTILNNNDSIDKKYDNNDKLSLKNIHILNDKNHQYEKERRKNVVSCDPINQSRLLNDYAIGIEDFYRERSSTIEMTSRNVELLNRRNQNIEKRHSAISLGGGGSIDRSFINSSINFDNFDNNNISRPPPPSTSPPRSPEPSNYDDKSRGAISRISESTSSLSSSSTRNSPSKINDQPLKYERKSPKEHERLMNVEEGVTMNSRFKVSSPSQTDSSWMKYDLSNNDIIFRNNLHRTSSLGSRSSTLSSASKTSSTSSTSISPRYSPIERKQSPCVSPQPGYEGLQLVQRSEIVVRVNTTIDASSQTDLIDDDKLFKNYDIVNLLSEPRKKLPEEIECEELSKDLVSQLGPNDKLAPILGNYYFNNTTS